MFSSRWTVTEWVGLSLGSGFVGFGGAWAEVAVCMRSCTRLVNGKPAHGLGEF